MRLDKEKDNHAGEKPSGGEIDADNHKRDYQDTDDDSVGAHHGGGPHETFVVGRGNEADAESHRGGDQGGRQMGQPGRRPGKSRVEEADRQPDAERHQEILLGVKQEAETARQVSNPYQPQDSQYAGKAGTQAFAERCELVRFHVFCTPGLRATPGAKSVLGRVI